MKVLLSYCPAKVVVYGGADRQSRNAGEIVPFEDLPDVLERFKAGG